MRAIRQFFFYVFLAVYLVAAPVAILYAFGYIYNPDGGPGLVRAGLVSINSTPDDAQVFLGASRYTRRTPTVIRDLLPGEYALRLVRAGYEPWQQRVTVAPERATVLDRVLLLPDVRPARRVDAQAWSDFFTTPGSPYAVLAGGTRLSDWAVLDAETAKLRPLLPADSPWRDAVVLNHWRVPRSPRLLLRIDDGSGERYLWIALDRERDAPLDITRLFPAAPDQVAWDRRARDEIYVRTGARVHRLDLEDLAMYPDCAPPAQAIAVYRRDLHIIDATGTLVRVERDGEVEEADPRLPPDLLTRGACAVLPDADEERWLVVEDRRLGLLRWREEGESDAAGWTTEWMYAHGARIDAAVWAYEDSHIAFTSGGQVWLLALERGGGGPPRFLGRTHADGALLFDARSGELYALDESRHLARTALVPPRSLLPLPQPAEESP
ncbi:MAG TPA: PEGA domain-containing protein [Kiritimatiellia bacterium]|nr:PEGA domain-containing protein [Kiritimatiellia bacterium]